MKLAFESSEVFTPVAQSIATLTNMAEISIHHIRYDAANGSVEIPMKRRELIQKDRRGCLGLILLRPSYKWGQNWIESILTIRQVTAMKLDVDDLLTTECNSCFNVMMGVKIENDRIYLGSLEEVEGKTLCEIFIEIQGINIELADRE